MISGTGCWLPRKVIVAITQQRAWLLMLVLSFVPGGLLFWLESRGGWSYQDLSSKVQSVLECSVRPAPTIQLTHNCQGPAGGHTVTSVATASAVLVVVVVREVSGPSRHLVLVRVTRVNRSSRAHSEQLTLACSGSSSSVHASQCQLSRVRRRGRSEVRDVTTTTTTITTQHLTPVHRLERHSVLAPD